MPDSLANDECDYALCNGEHLHGVQAENVDSEAEVARHITQFLELLYGSADRGHLVLWTKQNKKSLWYPASALEEIGREAARLAQTWDIYFGVGLQDKEAAQDVQGKRSGSKPHLSRTRGYAETVVCIPGLWVDIDIRSKAHAELNLPPTKEDAVKLVNEFPLAPTVLVDSGHGLHAYWLFREPLAIDSKEERDEAQDLVRRFQGTLQAIAARRGWKIDNTSDLARVLRLPGTVNRKREPVRVWMIECHEERRYNPSDFEPYLMDDAAHVDPFESPSPRAPVRCLPAIGPIVTGCAWMRHCRDDAAHLPEPEWYAMLSILGRCENGDALAHEWSAPYPGYSFEETTRKLKHALEAAGPRSCRDIRRRFGEVYCQGCAFWNKVTSPLALGLRAKVVDKRQTALLSSHNGVMQFPLEVLPAQLRRFVEEGSRAMPCPPDFIALPLLVALGTAVGTSRVLELKSNWTERACIFGAVVGDPGTKKSPALSLVSRFVWKRQELLRREYEREKREYEVKLKEYEHKLDQFKRGLRNGKASPQDRPEKPPEPVLKQVVVSDTTIEALADVLMNNPRGVVCINDELASWVLSMNQYKSGKGDDRQHWLKIWPGTTTIINRKNLKEPIIIENPFVSVIGCVPPDILEDLQDRRGREDGFIDRILFVYPDRIRDEWTDCEVSPTTLREVEDVFDRLWDVRDAAKDGSLEPVRLCFTPAAKERWIPWYDGHCQELSDEVPEYLRNPWAKLSGYCARLALIIQMARWACGEASDNEVDDVSVAAAIALVEYFKSHARRVYASLRGSSKDKRVDGALAWLRRRGGQASPRDVQRDGVAGVKNAKEALALLKELADQGYGVLEQRGKRNFRFTLGKDQATSD